MVFNSIMVFNCERVSHANCKNLKCYLYTTANVKLSKMVTFEVLFQLGCCLKRQEDGSLGLGSEPTCLC